ncbi:DUF2714 domain-containing protein [Mycoplasma sp. NEAQ87857]|uniref:MSC_0623 family F1-like ATPase-associated protein n=1 Tax=Mycoplasma sp. NEAQ87857 TaxID=2683967 RepID=UPI00131953C0|nr:DUF2714 domain-containing protein [Mycoplasma sp. NEAQ87857]QGZ97918.1 DUF2714 domain-containing protein [Mycoplasma sp. NEAQ87857]
MKKLKHLFKKNETNHHIDPEQERYQNLVFNEYDAVIKSNNFIPYAMLLNQFLLDNNISNQSDIYHEVFAKVNQNLKEKKEFIYQDFVITFTRDLRFSLNELVPDVQKTANVRVGNLNLTTSNNTLTNNQLLKFNQLLNRLLIENQFSVEILPNIVLRYDFALKEYKVFFGKELINHAN